jgi:hypothetical protein
MITVITNTAPCCAVFHDKEKDEVTTYPVAGWVVDSLLPDPGVPLVVCPRGLVRAPDYREEGAFVFVFDEGWTPDPVRARAVLNWLTEV